MSLAAGILCVTIWVSVISLSRVYCGMHSVLDLVIGTLLSMVLLIICLPITNSIEIFFATSKISPVFFLMVPILAIVYFPTTKQWTPTRGDTCCVAAVFCGIELGSWLNYQMGFIKETTENYPLTLHWAVIISKPFIARLILGLVVAAISEFIGKVVSYSFLCFLIGKDKEMLKMAKDSNDNKEKLFVDLSSKFLTYTFLGFNILFVVPQLFHFLNIGRDSFYSEL